MAQQATWLSIPVVRAVYGTKLAVLVTGVTDCESVMDIIRIIFSLFIPPLGVFLQVGLGVQFWINILLTILGYIPGVIHAAYIIFSR